MSHAEALLLDSHQVLGIPSSRPEGLFRIGTSDVIEETYRALARRWHPDINSNPHAEAVFKHLGALRAAALQKIAGGTWELNGHLRLTRDSGAFIHIHYLRSRPFELGQIYICEQALVFVVEPGFRDFKDNFVRRVRGFRFADTRMRTEFERILPKLRLEATTQDGRFVLVVDKPRDLVSLRDLHTHVAGRIEAEHIAWMISRLLNLCCYLEWHGLVHNDLSLDTCFISPEHHSVALLGGWWYATEIGKKMLGAPSRTLQLLPPDVLSRKTGNPRADLELVRAIARELMGDPSGILLTDLKQAPEALIAWSRMGTHEHATEDFRAWNRSILPAAFGPRKFHPFEISAREIYTSAM